MRMGRSLRVRENAASEHRDCHGDVVISGTIHEPKGTAWVE